MTELPSFQSPLLPVQHGFFCRDGGVSAAPYDSLNGGLGTEDERAAVQENRRRLAAAVNVPVEHFAALTQVHGAEVHMVRSVEDVPSLLASPEGDALVTDCPKVALGIATADCAPVLFSSDDGRIVGAAHAGWRGAVGGVLENTVKQMRLIGAEGIRAVVGPCIGPESYEVGVDMRRAVLENHSDADVFFRPSSGREGHYMFDLPAFCVARLEAVSVAHVEALKLDTLAIPRFFSHRRATLAGDSRTGRQISVIRPSM